MFKQQLLKKKKKKKVSIKFVDFGANRRNKPGKNSSEPAAILMINAPFSLVVIIS